MPSTLEEIIVSALMQDRAILASLLAAETPFEDGVLPLTAGGTGATSAGGALAAIGAAASSHTHDGSDIVSGTVAAARLGASPTASKLLFGNNTWATLSASDIPSHTHAAGDITSGTIATARLGSGTASASTLLFGDSTWSALAAGDIPSLDASKITTGTLAAARLGASPSATKLLFGDNTWAVLASSDLPSHTHNTSDINSGDLTVTRITTGSGYWTLGQYTAGAPAATGYVSVTIGGTSRKLLAG